MSFNLRAPGANSHYIEYLDREQCDEIIDNISNMRKICKSATCSKVNKVSHEADIQVYPTKEYLDYINKIYLSLDFDEEYEKSREVEHTIKSALEVRLEDLFNKYDVPVLRCLTCREVLVDYDGEIYISFNTNTNNWHFDLTDRIVEGVCKLLIWAY